ncbi:hypothetical protein AB0B28_17505 [Glycomyces sp. NPDC046736]|uniref:hypothetical protein n=1 Tax=Glycomyces sp. NPDC046736 TaxID=3155615 RepID=UPI0033ECC986
MGFEKNAEPDFPPTAPKAVVFSSGSAPDGQEQWDAFEQQTKDAEEYEQQRREELNNTDAKELARRIRNGFAY